MTKPSPSRFGPFEVLGSLGAGGMGEVYRARDPRLNREVAIKVLAHAGADPAQHRRLTEEAQAASALNHPNILTVHDVGVQDDVPYIVSELVDGTSLRGLLARAPLPVRDVLALSVQMADGLAAAHQAGIVHRDFKPENVMVTREGRVKLLDFGLALVGAQEGGSTVEATLTHGHVIQGTVPYMSPEQARGARVDYRTDQFSLGSTLYEMVTGRRAFQAETPPQTLTRILEDEPEPIAKLHARVPAPLRWVIERCLAKDPHHRYDSTADLARELRTLRDRLTEFTSSAEILPAAPARRRRWVPALVVAVGVAVGAIGAIALSGGSEAAFDQYRFTPFATDPGYQSSPAWSPDGKTLAYIATVDGVQQVFTKAVTSPLRNQVTRAPYDCFHPFWSADNTRLYYVSLQGARYGLWSISVNGGDREPVLENVTRAALSPDGKTLALWRAVDNDYAGVYTLWLSSPPGSPPTPYTRGAFGSTRFVDGRLRFSPDGTKLGISAVSTANSIGFWTVPMSGGDPHAVSGRFLVGGFSWLPDNRHVVGAVGLPRPGMQLWQVDTEDGDARLILPGEGMRAEPAVSPEGARIAMSVQQANYDMYRLSTNQPSPEAFLASARNEMDPVWSPKVSKMALTTDRSGTPEIWLSAGNGELERPLVTSESFPDTTHLLGSPAFSPDGQRIAYYRRSHASSRIWISQVAGGPPTTLTPGDARDEDTPTWSPDSGWIAYAHQSDATTGTWTLSKMRVGKATTPPVALVPRVRPYSPVKWAPTDAWIAFMGQDGLSIVSPDGQNSRVIAEAAWLAFEWSEDSQQLFGIRESDDYKHLTFASIDVRSGAERVLAANIAPLSVSNEPVRGFTRVSPTTFLTSIVHVSSDIWLFDGFQPPPRNLWERLTRRFRPPG